MNAKVITGPWRRTGGGTPPTPEYLAERRRLGMPSRIYDDDGQDDQETQT